MSFFIDKMGMRVIPTLIFFILMLVFLAPFPFGIINLGNCAGAGISAILTGIFAFYGKFCGLIQSFWQKPCGKIILSMAGIIIAVCISAVLIISFFMIRAARDNPGGNPTTLVVLGCQVRQGRPSLMLKRRLDSAYAYLTEHEEIMVIVSGGKGDDEMISEAECMRNYLVSAGIDENRIIMEDKSSNTRENLRFSGDIINEKGLEGKITIVSDGYHQLRAEMIASDLGIEAYNISAPTSPWLLPTYIVREWFGVAHHYVFGTK